MKLQDVIEQALSDTNFAQQLKEKAMSAHQAGIDTDEWEEFMSYFAATPEQLSVFRTLDDPNTDCTATTALTLTVTSTADCRFTTTTMTTTIFCEPEVAE